MGIVARCCDAIAMSEEGRLGLSGPDVVEATKGVEELDAADRALVWRTYGGKHRWILGEADLLVDDDVEAFRAAAIELLGRTRPISEAALSAEHALLAARLARAGGCPDAADVWRARGRGRPGAAPAARRGVVPGRRGGRAACARRRRPAVRPARRRGGVPRPGPRSALPGGT